MSQAHGDWDNPFPMRYLYQDPAAMAETIHCMEADLRSWRIADFLGWAAFLRFRSLARYDQPWGWKDPRMIFTLPLWLKIFPSAKIVYIDYKDTALLRKFISDRGKIRARRVTGVTVQQQRQLASAIKNAREMALLPYSSSAR